MNKSLVLRSCRSDGILLRPTKPATMLDAAWSASFHDLVPRYVQSAFSHIGGHRWSYVLSLNLEAEFSVTATDLHSSTSETAYVSYEYVHCAVGPYTTVSASTSSKLVLPARPQVDDLTPGWGYFVVAPVLTSGMWCILLLLGPFIVFPPASPTLLFSVELSLQL
jgi:hypothetical protein